MTPRFAKSLTFVRRTVFAASVILCATTLIAVADVSAPDSQLTTLPAMPVVTENGPLRIEMSLDTEQVAAGEPFDVRISFETTEGVSIAAPQMPELLGPFEVKDVRQEERDCPPPKVCVDMVLTLTGYIPGTLSIPPLTFGYIDQRPSSTGQPMQQQLQLEPFQINVANNLADIRGPESLPIPFQWRVIGIAAAVILGLALIGWIAKRYININPAESVLPSAPTLSPFEWAMREFRSLEQDNLVSAGRIKEFYFRINGILRGYIERQFRFNAGEQTSEEFVRSLQRDPRFNPHQRELLGAFVDACDPVKYAAQTPSVDEVEWVQRTAKEFVQRAHASVQEELQRLAESTQLREATA